MRLWTALLAAGLVSAGAAQAAPVWTVDAARSRIGFDSSFGGLKFSGVFRRWTADIAFDPQDLKHSRVRATIDTASAVTGQKERDEALPTPDWFDTAVFPKATFVTSGITAQGGGRYVAAGTLTLKGVARPVSLPFTLTITGGTATMTGALMLDRSQFGVGAGPFAAEDTVPHAVPITIAVTAVRK